MSADLGSNGNRLVQRGTAWDRPAVKGSDPRLEIKQDQMRIKRTNRYWNLCRRLKRIRMSASLIEV
jgi:hypothetical protein